MRRADVVKRIPLSPEILKEIQREVEAIDKILSDEKFSAINAKFQKFYEKNDYDKPWYEIYGISSIRKVAADSKNAESYNHFYGSFSEITHGGNIWKNISLEGENFSIPIREPAKIVRVANLAASFAFNVFRIILNEYIPKELPDFEHQYKTEWRTRFLKTTPQTK